MNKKSNSKRTIKQVLALAFTLILLIAGSYAWLTLQVTGNKTNILRAGTLKLTLDDITSNGISLENTVPMSDEKGKTTTEYTFTLQNTGTTVGYTIYLDDVALTDGEKQLEDSKVKYQLTKNGAETVALLSSLDNKVIDTGTINQNKTNTYSLRVWIDSDAGNEVMGKILSKELRVVAEQTKKEKIKAYTYSETGNNKCINGEEETCVETTCYKTKTANSCIQGTIIKYYVNDTEQKVFYVLHDDGSTITMQQRENTVRNIPWYKDADDSTKGPLTILPSLEAATETWTNVEFQEYTAGYTNFYQNAYTGCTHTGDYKITCSVNTYNGDQANLTLSKRKVRARMITAQEASSTSCLVWKDGSKDSTIMGNSIDAWNNGTCPDWMHNYLYQSKTYGGSYEDNTVNENGQYNYDYWTMSADSSDSPRAWFVRRGGGLGYSGTSDTDIGARAVVVISK